MLHPHYPLEYATSRAYARSALKELQSLTPGQLSTKAATDIAAKHVLLHLSKVGWSPDKLSVMSQETQGLLMWLEWVSKGKNLVSVSPSLSQAFERSDCADMGISDVLPQNEEVVYIHFSGQLESPIEISHLAQPFEGAYVAVHKEALRIVLCSRCKDTAGALDKWQERYDLRVSHQHFGLTADEAVAYALAEDLADLRNARATLSQKSPSLSAEADLLMARMQEGAEAYRRALSLVLNALAYRKAYPSDTLAQWTPRAPANLVKLATTGAPKQAQSAKSKLWQLGHLPVVCLGEQFSAPPCEEGAGVKMHWRRGHWRHQAYGEGHSLRKLIWLQPVRVGRSA